jgi:hypothetical protein
MAMVRTAAIIGSFKQHYEEIRVVWQRFNTVGLHVTSPKGTPIIKPGIPFVRFESDPAHWSDAFVQTVALHRIVRADFVYVVTLGGYVGRTTCYEIGRIIQAARPIYFSEHPHDLPIAVPDSHIIDSKLLVARIADGTFDPVALYVDERDRDAAAERALIKGVSWPDDQFSK